MMNSQARPALILLVEDRRMDVELTLDAFRETQISNRVEVVATGELALDYLFGRPPYLDRDRYPLPGLVLLDLKLPGIDGHEVLRQIKTTTGLKRIPVVVLSSSSESRDRTQSYDNGVNSFMVKPTSFAGFMEVVRRIEDYWLSLNVPATD